MMLGSGAADVPSDSHPHFRVLPTPLVTTNTFSLNIFFPVPADQTTTQQQEKEKKRCWLPSQSFKNGFGFGPVLHISTPRLPPLSPGSCPKNKRSSRTAFSTAFCASNARSCFSFSCRLLSGYARPSGLACPKMSDSNFLSFLCFRAELAPDWLLLFGRYISLDVTARLLLLALPRNGFLELGRGDDGSTNR